MSETAIAVTDRLTCVRCLAEGSDEHHPVGTATVDGCSTTGPSEVAPTNGDMLDDTSALGTNCEGFGETGLRLAHYLGVCLEVHISWTSWVTKGPLNVFSDYQWLLHH